MQLELMGQRPAVVSVASGARAAEAGLCAEVDRLVAAGIASPPLLRQPVRVVVPSRSLRLHVAAAIVRGCGRAAPGVVVQTLFGVAAEVLERAGVPAIVGGSLFDVLAQRHARREEVLDAVLAELTGGFAPAARSIRDLLEAGLVPAQLDPLLELLDDALATRGRGRRGPQPPERRGPRLAPEEVERAAALMRAAAGTRLAMDAYGLDDAVGVLVRARELLDGGGPSALPTRAAIIFGFADGTAVVSDLLEALVRHVGARLLVADAPDPVTPRGGPLRTPFVQRISERLAAFGGAAPVPFRNAQAEVALVQAPDVRAEVREVVERARALIAAGMAPERVGVVARSLDPFRGELRTQLARLGVPFSGVGERAPHGPARRLADALLAVLRLRADAPMDRWLDALAAPEGGADPRGDAWKADLRLWFRTVGAARLAHVAELAPPDGGDARLPIRRGFSAEEGEDAVSTPARTVPAELVRATVLRARALLDALAAMRAEPAALGVHLGRLRATLEGPLGWRPDDDPFRERVLARLAVLSARPLEARVKLSWEELLVFLEPVLEELGSAPLGGRGGGVQVLSAKEARGRTFEHLFILGMNRGVFPGARPEDPLLPDGVRARLAALLPDVALRREHFAAERFLFAQLASSTPALTVSWHLADDDGRALNPSPFVERLKGRLPVVQAAPLLAAERPRPRPADEHAITCALAGARGALGEMIGVARDDAALGRLRVAVLDELDPDRRTAAGVARAASLGPYFGFVGTPGALDPRRRALWITTLEAVARCPWQVVLERLLRLEPAPDPLEALPHLDARVQGDALHDALEALVRRDLGRRPRELDAVVGAGAVVVRWPPAEEVLRVVLDACRRVLVRHGIPYPGLAPILAEQVMAFLAVAREADFASPEGRPVLGVEVLGAVTVKDLDGQDRRVHFRADRVDEVEGEVILTDYKRGRPPSAGKKDETRRRHLLDGVRHGRHLQGVAYALAGVGRGTAGRYLHLLPGVEPAAREVRVAADDGALGEAFDEALRRVLAAWDDGALFPRLTDPTGLVTPRACATCQVAEACLQGDSGARRRLAEWQRAPAMVGTGRALEAARDLWAMGEGDDEEAPS